MGAGVGAVLGVGALSGIGAVVGGSGGYLAGQAIEGPQRKKLNDVNDKIEVSLI